MKLIDLGWISDFKQYFSNKEKLNVKLKQREHT